MKCNSIKIALIPNRHSITLLCNRAEGAQKLAEHRPALLFDLDA